MKSKLTMTQWDEVRAKYDTGRHSLVDLALEYNVSKSRIYHHITYGTRSINGGRPKKLSEEQIKAIIEKYLTGAYSHVMLGLEYGVAAHVVRYHLKKAGVNGIKHLHPPACQQTTKSMANCRSYYF